MLADSLDPSGKSGEAERQIRQNAKYAVVVGITNAYNQYWRIANPPEPPTATANGQPPPANGQSYSLYLRVSVLRYYPSRSVKFVVAFTYNYHIIII